MMARQDRARARRGRAVALMMALLLVGGMARGASPGGADDGIDAKSIDRFLNESRKGAAAPLTAAERQKLVGLSQAAAAFRALMIADQAALRRDFSTPQAKALIARFLGKEGTLQGPLWQFFMTGTQIYIGEGRAETIRVGFYNPELDGWVLSDWQPSGDAAGVPHFALRQLNAVSGELMRGVKTAAWRHAQWVTLKDRSPTLSLMASHRLGTRAFAARFPVAGRELPAPMRGIPDQRRLVLERTRMAYLSLTALVREPAYGTAVGKLRAALAIGDRGALTALFGGRDPGGALRLLSLSSVLRASLVPAMVLDKPDGRWVALVPPLAGRWVALARFELGADKQAVVLTTLDFIDLTQGEDHQP